jgi:hypothetical protein
MHNDEMRKKAEKQSSFIANDKTELYIDRFGFDTITCCGYLPQTNDWHDNWPVCEYNFNDITGESYELPYLDRD